MTWLWTEAEVGALRDLFPDHSNQHIATLLGRSRAAIESKGRDLMLRKVNPHPERPERPSATLREEIAAAKREAATASLYRSGPWE